MIEKLVSIQNPATGLPITPALCSHRCINSINWLSNSVPNGFLNHSQIFVHETTVSNIFYVMPSCLLFASNLNVYRMSPVYK